MTKNTFNFELVSPERKLMSERAWQVVIPGAEGVLGVRAGHAPFIVSARSGVVEMIAAPDDSTPTRFFIAGGFADITADNVTLLAEQAVNVNDLDKEMLTTQITDLEDELSLLSDGDPDKEAQLQAQIDFTRAQLAAVMVA